MMDIDNAAKHSRLNIKQSVKNLFKGQVQSIINYIDKLNELDTTSVEPTSHILPINNVFREDSLRESLPRNKALQNAPQKDEDFYRVPRIIE
jgi:aspartyl-tRNA(Asn)/glutamyl-tRNA(Gln) amidotransferase subunit C